MKVLRKNLATGKSESFKLKDRNGNETTNRQRILEITKNFYKELYKGRQNKNNLDSPVILKNKLINKGSEDLSDITMVKVRNAFKKIKNNKAGKVSLKPSSCEARRVSLFNLCLHDNKTSERWNNTMIIHIHNKGDITNLLYNMFLELFVLLP